MYLATKVSLFDFDNLGTTHDAQTSVYLSQRLGGGGLAATRRSYRQHMVSLIGYRKLGC